MTWNKMPGADGVTFTAGRKKYDKLWRIMCADQLRDSKTVKTEDVSLKARLRWLSRFINPCKSVKGVSDGRYKS